MSKGEDELVIIYLRILFFVLIIHNDLHNYCDSTHNINNWLFNNLWGIKLMLF